MSPRPRNFEKGKLNKEFFKTSYASIRRFMPLIILASIFLVAGVVIEIIAPQYLKKLTDTIADGGLERNIDMGLVTEYGTILIILYSSFAVLSYFAAFIFTNISRTYAADLRNSLIKKVNKLSLRYFDSHQIGDTMSRITNDVDSIANVLDSTISSFIKSIFLLIGSLAAMFYTSWQLALIAIAMVPLLILFTAFNMKLARPQFKKRQKQIGVVNGIVEENYSGQQIIKAFGAEKRKEEEFNIENESLGKTMFKAQIFGGLMMPVFNLVSYLGFVAVLLVGGILIARNDPVVTLGTLTAFIVYIRLFQQPLNNLAQVMNNLQTVSAASERVRTFLREEEPEDESDKERKFPIVNGKVDVKGEVIFDHVSFGYEADREIIHDFSAKIKPGMKVAIVGPTGAGKTTMVNLLMRFYELKGGDIKIDGISTKEMKKEEIRDIFGMVLQDTWVYNGTIKDNLIYNTPNVSDEEVEQVLKDARLDHFVSSLPNGVDYEISDASSISGGQKQLITIARAMIRKSPLLILDEATSNVDTRTEEMIQEAMDNLMKGRTSFVIAHRLSTIRNADLILVMKDGDIVEQGTHDSLMEKDGFYASMYKSQFVF
ncbi:MAG: ABC transporter ATP-binding protein [Bacilli bacterium]|nr:ABC transporter ATP-binding protein [Bacilli bacterium]